MASSVSWPYGAVTSGSFRRVGARVTALREFVLKVHQRCNLACDYCYVYTKADQSWRNRPAMMPESVWRAAAFRIGDHARAHGIPEVRVILHGGEPLLAGANRLTEIADAVRAAVAPPTRVTVALQTNGLLLTDAVLTELLRHRIRVAVSIDGPQAAHDTHRRHADGRGSFAALRVRLDRLSQPPFREIFAGLLCAVDPRTDPDECYQTLTGFAPPAVDLLLPHANWDTGTTSTGYGTWLARFFDIWFDEPVKPTAVRLFDELIQLQLGGTSRSEHVGLSPAAVAVIESDGAIEQTDALKSAYPDAAATGLSVLTDPFEAALSHPGILARQLGRHALAETCLGCRVRDVCGGGHYAHRYRSGTGFRNPTVYCTDMLFLIDHVAERIRTRVAERMSSHAG
jgi:uncharacterized protein